MAWWTCWIGSSSGTWANPSSAAAWRRRSPPRPAPAAGRSPAAAAGPRAGGVGEFGDGVGGSGDHALADPAGLGDGDAEPEGGEDERVVGLRDVVGEASRSTRAERAAGGHQREPRTCGVSPGVRHSATIKE